MGHETAVMTHSQGGREELSHSSNINTRFPPELLSEVFTLYAQFHARAFHDHVRNPSGECFSLPYIWIRIAHVCRHWRCTALCTPHIWEYILVDRPKMAVECLYRSRGIPICVWQYRSAPLDIETQETMKTILCHFPRIYDLHISSILVDDGPVMKFPGVEHLTAPFLTSATFINPSSCGAVLDLMLELNPPRLTRLELDEIDSHHWCWLPYPPGLKFLRVEISVHRYCTYPGKIPASTSSRFSFLETLHIISRCDPPVPQISNFEAQPELPNLKFLFVSARSAEKCLELFKFPTDTQVRLSVMFDRPDPPDFGRFVELCGSPVFRTFAVISWSFGNSFSFCGWRETLSMRQLRLRRDPPHFTLNTQIQWDDIERFVSTLQQTLNTVHTLEFVEHGKDGSGLFKAICKSSRNAQNLGLDGNQVNIYGSFPPLVRSLTLQSMIWDFRIDPLRTYLQERIEGGTRLESLEIPPTLRANDFVTLKTFVDEVTDISVPYPEAPDWEGVFLCGASPY